MREPINNISRIRYSYEDENGVKVDMILPGNMDIFEYTNEFRHFLLSVGFHIDSVNKAVPLEGTIYGS